MGQVKCGNCKGTHLNANGVRACYGFGPVANRPGPAPVPTGPDGRLSRLAQARLQAQEEAAEEAAERDVDNWEIDRDEDRYERYLEG